MFKIHFTVEMGSPEIIIEKLLQGNMRMEQEKL